MKRIMTKGIYYLQPIFIGCCSWFWGEDYTSGDLYEAEELYKAQMPIKSNRFILMHCPEGEVVEPLKLAEGQYFGMPLYYEHKVYMVMVDFREQKIHLLVFDPDEVLLGGEVHTLDILPLSHVEDCYNLLLKGTSVLLTRQSNEQYFQILWSLENGRMDVGFQLEERESFSHRNGDRLYFSSWWETEEPEYEYHEEIIVRNMKGEILERFEGGIQEIGPGEYYILQ